MKLQRCTRACVFVDGDANIFIMQLFTHYLVTCNVLARFSPPYCREGLLTSWMGGRSTRSPQEI